MTLLSQTLFKAYDIRGIVGETLTAEVAQQIGQSIGSAAREQNILEIVIGRDGRLSGPSLAQALAQGIRSTGVNVIDIGCVVTPMLYFAAHHLGTQSGVMVTGSHNPAQYNGFKMMLAGETLAGDQIQALYQRIQQQQFTRGQGKYRTESITEAYFERITESIQLSRPMEIVIDCGNGIAGAYAPALFRRLGCHVHELFCEVDGNFPNHHPDPAKPENLRDMIDTVAKTKAELGLAFDGDGDRLGIVTKEGNIIWPDRQLMLLAADVLARHPNAKVIYDVKSTRLLAPWIQQNGGQAVMCRTGHSFIKAKIKETGALLAGEMSGHIFFKERWFGFDDGLYAGARLLEILSRSDNPSAVLNALPNALSTPELNIHTQEGENHRLITQLQHAATFTDAQNIICIDGLRVEYPDGFGLMRASNTTPTIVLRFEADNESSLARIQDDFRQALSRVTQAPLPF